MTSTVPSTDPNTRLVIQQHAEVQDLQQRLFQGIISPQDDFALHNRHTNWVFTDGPDQLSLDAEVNACINHLRINMSVDPRHTRIDLFPGDREYRWDLAENGPNEP